MTTSQYDVVVVGSGASGSFAAMELTARGLRVALVEAGRRIGPEDFARPPKGPVEKGIQLGKRAIATISGQYRQAKVAFYGHQFRHLFVNDLENPYTTTREQPYLWIRGRQLGGRLHTYGRVLMRWSDTDFKAGSRDGQSPDWPISYAELAPYYDRVEEFLGLCGTSEGIPNLPDGKYLKDAHLTRLETRLKDAVESGWPGRHVIPWRYMPPNAKRVPQPILAAMETGLLKILTDTIVRRVLTDETGARATGIETVNRLTKETGRVDARAVVLCCSPVETVRLMLNSASPRHPNGLANASGVLGRYFMDQAPMVIFGSDPKVKGQEVDETWPADPWYGRTGGAYIPRWLNVGDTEQCVFRGFGYQGTAGRLHVSPEKGAQWAFMGFCETLPNAANRITLSARKDRWGVPVPHIRCWIGENERELLRRAIGDSREMAEAAGLDVEWIGSPLGLQEFGRGAYPDSDPVSRFFFRRFFRSSMTMGAAIHESGGARMGEDPDSSVLDRWNRTWQVPNLLVTDASAFPTSGTAGTTLTIMAMTLRACGRLADELGA